jgi:hypothetical protein
MSVLTYACPTWEYAVDTHLLKLQHLQNRLLCSLGNLDRSTQVRVLHVAFKIPYVYDYIIKLCRKQAELILNRANRNMHGIGQAFRPTFPLLFQNGIKSTSICTN